MKELHELREMLCDELKEYGKKGDLTAGSLNAIDTIAHAVKNIDKIMEDDGYSGYYPASYNDRMRSYGYSRGRSMNRDSRGRYSRDGGMIEELRSMMDDAQDDRTRQELQRFISKMENM